MTKQCEHDNTLKCILLKLVSGCKTLNSRLRRSAGGALGDVGQRSQAGQQRAQEHRQHAHLRAAPDGPFRLSLGQWFFG